MSVVLMSTSIGHAYSLGVRLRVQDLWVICECKIHAVLLAFHYYLASVAGTYNFVNKYNNEDSAYPFQDYKEPWQYFILLFILNCIVHVSALNPLSRGKFILHKGDQIVIEPQQPRLRA